MNNIGYKVVKPDFNNSLLNLIATIKHHYNLDSEFEDLIEVRDAIKNKKHIVLLLLDGMGKSILDKNLSASSFLNKNIKKVITSVFPPTTVAATTSLNSGIAPNQSGWVGWQQYFKEINRFVVLFQNKDYYTNENIEFDVVKKYIPYKPLVEEIREKGYETYELYPAFKENGFTNFKDMCDKINEICNKDESSYTYAYWDKPDFLLHEYGCNNDIIKNNLEDLNKTIEKLVLNLPKDSIVLVTADHGLVDVEPILLPFYPKVMKYVKKPIALEPRSSVFYVKNKNKFRIEFNKAFGEWFDLYSLEEFSKSNYMYGNIDKVKEYLGDFIAIAKDKYYFVNEENPSFIFKGHHAGTTEEEMYVPLIFH